MKVTQELVNRLMAYNLDNITEPEYKAFLTQAERIKSSVLKQFNVNLSVAEAMEFWGWRSQQYDAGWLGLNEKDSEHDEEVKDFFTKFLDSHWTLEDDEPFPKTLQDRSDVIFCFKFILGFGLGDFDYIVPDTILIRKKLKETFNVDLSLSEAAYYWSCHCNDWDSNWLGSDEKWYANYFQKFFDNFYEE